MLPIVCLSELASNIESNGDTNPSANTITCDAFQQIYNVSWLSLHGHTSSTYSIRLAPEAGEIRLVTGTHRLNKAVLQHLGHCSNKFEINNFFMSTFESKVINELVNEYAKSIIALRLDFVKRETLEQYTKPLEAVENFSFTTSKETIGTHVISFDKLLPKVRELKAQINPEYDYSFMFHDLMLNQ